MEVFIAFKCLAGRVHRQYHGSHLPCGETSYSSFNSAPEPLEPTTGYFIIARDAHADIPTIFLSIGQKITHQQNIPRSHEFLPQWGSVSHSPPGGAPGGGWRPSICTRVTVIASHRHFCEAGTRGTVLSRPVSQGRKSHKKMKHPHCGK